MIFVIVRGCKVVNRTFSNLLLLPIKPVKTLVDRKTCRENNAEQDDTINRSTLSKLTCASEFSGRLIPGCKKELNHVLWLTRHGLKIGSKR